MYEDDDVICTIDCNDHDSISINESDLEYIAMHNPISESEESKKSKDNDYLLLILILFIIAMLAGITVFCISKFT